MTNTRTATIAARGTTAPIPAHLLAEHADMLAAARARHAAVVAPASPAGPLTRRLAALAAARRG